MKLYTRLDFFVGWVTVDLNLLSPFGIKARLHMMAERAYRRIVARFGCQHPDGYRATGPRMPLMYGSAATEVCDLCGKFRYDHHGWSRWQPGPVPTERDEEM